MTLQPLCPFIRPAQGRWMWGGKPSAQRRPLGAGCREHIPTPHPQLPHSDTPAPQGGPAWPNSANTELRLPDPEPSISAIICKKRGQPTPGGASEPWGWGCPRGSGSFTEDGGTEVGAAGSHRGTAQLLQGAPRTPEHTLPWAPARRALALSPRGARPTRRSVPPHLPQGSHQRGKVRAIRSVGGRDPALGRPGPCSFSSFASKYCALAERVPARN